MSAKVGAPSCPAAIKAAVGLTFQCLVPFDTTAVGFLVTIGAGGALDVRPTFPVVSLSSARLLAGANSSCGAAKAKFAVLPVGSVLECTLGGATAAKTATTVRLRVFDEFGNLRRV